jgi:hypothetical protein
MMERELFCSGDKFNVLHHNDKDHEVRMTKKKTWTMLDFIRLNGTLRIQYSHLLMRLVRNKRSFLIMLWALRWGRVWDVGSGLDWGNQFLLQLGTLDSLKIAVTADEFL